MKRTILTLMAGMVGLIPLAVVSAEEGKTSTIISPCVALAGADSRVAEPGYHRIVSLEDWTRIWRQHKGLKQDKAYDLYMDPAGLPLVDFDRFMVIAIFRGSGWNSAGVKAISMVEEQERMVLRFEDKAYQTFAVEGPGAEGPAYQAAHGGNRVTAYGFFVIPRATKAVVLEENVQNVLGKPPVWKERFTFPKR